MKTIREIISYTLIAEITLHASFVCIGIFYQIVHSLQTGHLSFSAFLSQDVIDNLLTLEIAAFVLFAALVATTIYLSNLVEKRL